MYRAAAPRAITGYQGGGRGRGAKLKNSGFFRFLGVLGVRKGSRGFLEPVGAILHKYLPKRSHMDLFQSIFDDFCAFSQHFAAFPGCVGGLELRYSYASPQKIIYYSEGFNNLMLGFPKGLPMVGPKPWTKLFFVNWTQAMGHVEPCGAFWSQLA